MQGVDYTYTIRGQLKAINTPNRDVATDPGNDGLLNQSDVRDAFGMSLSYYSGDYARTSTSTSISSPFNSGSASLLSPTVDLYSGLIGTTTWSTQDHSNPAADIVREEQTIGEAYRYDVLGRLRSVTTHKKETNSWTAEPTGGWSSSYKYDPHGNFLRLKRQTLDATETTIAIDDATFMLTPGSNKLSSVSDPQSFTIGQGQEVERIDAADLALDEKGRTEQSNSLADDAITGYNSADQVENAVRGTESTSLIYDISGNVVRQDVTDGEDVVRFYTIPALANADRAVYRSTTSAPAISEWSILGLGRIGVDRTTQAAVVNGVNVRSVGTTLYELADNVGSVRAIVCDVVDPDPNNQGFFRSKVVSSSDYEAYGPRRKYRYSDLVDPYRYGWQGMKFLDGLDRKTDYITINRLYDVRLGRWNRPDPVFKPSLSPYQAMGLNPVSFIDPLGLDESTDIKPGSGGGGFWSSIGGFLGDVGQGLNSVIADVITFVGDIVSPLPEGYVSIGNLVVEQVLVEESASAQVAENLTGIPQGHTPAPLNHGTIASPPMLTGPNQMLVDIDRIPIVGAIVDDLYVTAQAGFLRVPYPLHLNGHIAYPAEIQSAGEGALLTLAPVAANGLGSVARTFTAALTLEEQSIVATQKGTYSVYQGVDEEGVVRYIGITKRNPKIRFDEHANAGNARSLLQYTVIDDYTALQEIEARIAEQTFINTLGLQKNGGLLLNKINSIAPRDWWMYGIK